MLLHAAHRWPNTIISNLWPQALKHATNIRNALPRAGQKESPLSLFSGTTVQANLSHFHPFGCPVYILQEPLQGQRMYPKWNEHSKVGIYLGRSPHHASTIPLILNTQTGLVSPQFHLVYDDHFDTVTRDKHFSSLWQYKAKLQDSTSEEGAAPSDSKRTDVVATENSVLPHALCDYSTSKIPLILKLT